MKQLLSFILLATLAVGASAQVEWKTIEQASKVEVKTNTKLFFVDFYTSWCGWCKKMDRETFKDPLVAKILNTYYIPVKFDAEGTSEFTWQGTKYTNTMGPRTTPSANTHNFAKAILGAKMGFPSFGVFGTDQRRLTVIQGYQSAADFVVALWYYASGDYKHYAFEKYQQIFDKEIRPAMNAKLGI